MHESVQILDFEVKILQERVSQEAICTKTKLQLQKSTRNTINQEANCTHAARDRPVQKHGASKYYLRKRMITMPSARKRTDI